jgi:competence protein ComEA
MRSRKVLTILLVSLILCAGLYSSPAGATGPEGKPKIDINKASSEELVQLPRIGQKMAERIVQYRQEHGPFKTVEDLKGVKGIGDKVLEQLRPSITVSR